MKKEGGLLEVEMKIGTETCQNLDLSLFAQSYLRENKVIERNNMHACTI